VVETGLDLLRDRIREEMETMDMVMRASQKAGDETDSEKDQVVEIAKRWREFVGFIPSLSGSSWAARWN
jgi:hypothetical protein